MTSLLIAAVSAVAGFVLGYYFSRMMNTWSMSAPLENHFSVSVSGERLTLHLYNKSVADFVIGDLHFAVKDPPAVVPVPTRDIVEGDIDVEGSVLMIPPSSRIRISFNLSDFWKHVDAEIAGSPRSISGYFTLARRTGNYSVVSRDVTISRPAFT